MHIRRGISGIIRNFWLMTKKRSSRIVFMVKKIKRMQIYRLNEKSKKVFDFSPGADPPSYATA